MRNASTASPLQAPGPPGRHVQIEGGPYAFLPDPLPPQLDYSPSLMMRLGEADRALGGVDSIADFVPNPWLLVLPFLKVEAALSSRIEGTQTTPNQLFEAAVTPPADLSAETVEVVNYLEAMDLGLESLAGGPLSMTLVRALHAKLLTQARGADRTPGAYRTDQVFVAARHRQIADASYVPPPALMIPGLMDDLERFLRPQSEIPPLVQCALVHAQFEMIHPFFDGNGRIGRLLLSLMLIAWGHLRQPLLFLSAFLERHRAEYYSCLLGISQRGDWQGWISFFLECVSAQSRQAVAAAMSLISLRNDVRTELQRGGATSNVLKLIDLLFQNPYTTIPLAAEQLAVSMPTASKIIHGLERKGFLEEVTGRSWRQRFRATQILTAIESATTAPADAPTQPHFEL